MSITKITDPSALPLSTADYQNQNTQSERLLNNVNQPFPIDSANIKKGSLFNIGGDMFYCGADTTISGTASDYVKLVVSGTDAAPEYVADLTGVAWSDAYNGYYDGSGNLYVFDEAKALVNSELSVLYSKIGKLFEVWIGQALRTTDSPTFAAINTGHGANEVYPMNQSVRTVDNVTFATVNTGYGSHDIYPPDTFSSAYAEDIDYTLPSLSIGQTGFSKVILILSSTVRHIYLPQGGTYAYSTTYFYIKPSNTESNNYSGNAIPGGTPIIAITSHKDIILTSYRRLT